MKGAEQEKDSDMACPICTGKMDPCITAQDLGKHPAQYEVCNACGFLRAHEPHWLDEAYSSAIAAADTGLVMRNIGISPQCFILCSASAVKAVTWTPRAVTAC